MFFVSEKILDKNSVTIQVDGYLDSDSIPVLREVFDHHLSEGKKVTLNLGNLSHVSREGREFLREMENRISLVGLPPFIRT